MAGVHPEAIGRGIAEQIGLACRISPAIAARRLTTARAWWFELPETYRHLVSGELSERIADQVVSETRHLEGKTRRAVDQHVAAAGISRMGRKAATARVRTIGYEADRNGYLQRAGPSGSIAGSASARHQTEPRPTVNAANLSEARDNMTTASQFR